MKPDRLSERQQIDWLALLHEALTVEGSVADIDNRFAKLLLRQPHIASSPATVLDPREIAGPKTTAHAPTSPYPPEPPPGAYSSGCCRRRVSRTGTYRVTSLPTPLSEA